MLDHIGKILWNETKQHFPKYIIFSLHLAVLISIEKTTKNNMRHVIA